MVACSIHIAEKSLCELHTGQFDIPVVNLQQPPQKWMIRPVDMAYVSRLKNVISNNPDHEKMTEPPMAIAPVEKVDFHLGNIKSYKLQVVGGVHRLMAWKALLEETKDQRLTTRRCSVYAAGMSLMAILRLANQHNQINSLTKQTTFMEHVQKSRELLFLEFGGGKQDDGEYMPALPHYNHHDYIKLKQLCLAHIVGPSVVSSCRHLISSMM